VGSDYEGKEKIRKKKKQARFAKRDAFERKSQLIDILGEKGTDRRNRIGKRKKKGGKEKEKVTARVDRSRLGRQKRTSTLKRESKEKAWVYRTGR